ncbi:MAG TPA: hypothetical protein VHR43_17765 [Gemmatimonadales bacterium]|nr:hypothetical protein [Gemmatimonadales bacterium]
MIADEERLLVGRLARLPLSAFDFHGYTARGRTMSFGRHYDFAGRRLEEAEHLPGWLLRDLAAGTLPIPPEA